MSANEKQRKENTNFRFCSSTADDVWHPSDQPAAYEWWYFDAVSDDGRDALTVIFLDNFIFSPRYNKTCRTTKSEQGETTDKFPAIAFCYYRDGKVLYRAINEFAPKDFSARTDFPACRIGNSRFDFEATPYGVRYLLDIEVVLRGSRRLSASLEWLIIERDFLPAPNDAADNAHFWNLAAPRADVTGKIAVFSRGGNRENDFQFRGTGYHDHNLDARWLPATVLQWQWGRAHFADATAVYYRYCEKSGASDLTKLFLIQESDFAVFSPACAESKMRRNVFGVKYPKTIEFSTENSISLSVKQTRTIDASFFYLRFLSEMELDLGDGEKHKTVGITEHLAPRTLGWRFLDWLVNMRIGRNGGGAFLP